MFVTDDAVRATCGPLPGRSPRICLDGVELPSDWVTAEVHIAADRLSRWQRTRLLWAPVLRRVRLRVRRPDVGRATVTVRRRRLS